MGAYCLKFNLSEIILLQNEISNVMKVKKLLEDLFL